MKNLADVCKEHNVPLFMDGARLGYGLMSDQSDLTFEDIAKNCDIFYIGGTKIGALCGEAIVFTKNNEPKHFTTRIKQHGALLAKGRLVGVQFLELFTNNLYLDISRHAINMANKMKKGFLEKAINFTLIHLLINNFLYLVKKRLKKQKSSRFGRNMMIIIVLLDLRQVGLLPKKM